MHLAIDVNDGEGIELSQYYKVGSYFPLFVLADSSGATISRWTGYTTARRFIMALENGLSDLTTVKERIDRFQVMPAHGDALFLAEYYSDIGEYPKAADFYRQAKRLDDRGVIDYTYKIFENTANACWKDMAPFDEVLNAADSVLASERNNKSNTIKVAQIMTKLAKKKNETGQLAKYLRAGIDSTANSKGRKSRESHEQFLADYELYINRDTTKAINIRKASQGENWVNSPDKYYSFAEWCLERKINLEEAELYARRAANRASPGKLRAKVLNTVAEICYARGNTSEAIKWAKMAIIQDPDEEKYVKQFERFQEGSGK